MSETSQGQFVQDEFIGEEKGNQITNVVVVLSDQYFKSKSCMFELLQLSQHEDFYDRIFPVAAEGTSIYEAEDLLRYTAHWDEKAEQLQAQIKSAKNIANLQGITDDLNLYVEIRQNIANLNRGNFYLNLKKYDQAVQAFETSLQLQTKYPSANQRSMAEAYERSGRALIESEQDVEKGIEYVQKSLVI